jgi:hypothetical protein
MEDIMNKIKKLLFSGFFALMLVGGFNVTQVFASDEVEEVKKGPFETYYDCSKDCIKRTAPWSIRRTICAADCYVSFVGDVIDELF